MVQASRERLARWAKSLPYLATDGLFVLGQEPLGVGRRYIAGRLVVAADFMEAGGRAAKGELLLGLGGVALTEKKKKSMQGSMSGWRLTTAGVVWQGIKGENKRSCLHKKTCFPAAPWRPPLPPCWRPCS